MTELDPKRARLSRRQLLAAAGVLLPSVGRAEPRQAPPHVTEPSSASAVTWTRHDLKLPGNRDFGAARLLLPRGSAPERLLVLLHGRGETVSERAALEAWQVRYGLQRACERLLHPPVTATSEAAPFAPERLQRVNAQLSERPFRALALLCPRTPNPAAADNRAALFDAFSAFLVEALIPEARRLVPSLGSAIGLDGCSMGGYVAWEVALRHPAAFASLGSVQCAMGAWRAKGFALRAKAAFGSTPPPIHVLTSSKDPFLEANRVLSESLDEAKLPNQLVVLPGAHDQPWLRQAGSLEMLLWHDRVLRG